MANDFFHRLDQASDYRALVAHFYGEARLTGDELWLKDPRDDTPQDKFSINALDGRYRNHKHSEGGSFIQLVKATHSGSWRDEWAKACPQTADIFNPPGRSEPQSVPRSPGEKPTRRTKTFAERAESGFKKQNPDDMDEFVSAYKVSEEFLLAHWLYVQKGGPMGPTLRLNFPISNATSGEVVGIKCRAVGKTIQLKDGRTVKSKNQFKSKSGLIGWDQQKMGTVLVVEGEKDWIVAAHDLPDFHVVSPSHGAAVFDRDSAYAMRGRDIVFLYDEDDAGNSGARKAATLCFGEAQSVKIARLGTPDKDVYDWLRTHDDELGKEKLLEIIAAAQDFDPTTNPGEIDNFIRTKCSDDEAEPEAIADLLFRIMREHGAMFTHRDGHDQMCAWRDRVYFVDGSDAHWAQLLYKYTGVGSRSTRGARMHTQIQQLVSVWGEATAATSWFVRKDDKLYLPLYGEDQQLVEISPDGITTVHNGYEGVVLMPDVTVEKIEYLDDFQYDPELGEAAWNQMISLLNFTEKWRQFVSAAVLALPFYAWCGTHPLLRFQGPAGTGKSKAAENITTFLYGKNTNSSGETIAALYRIAGTRMVLSRDNLELRTLDAQREFRELLLSAATGMTRYKSSKDSDRDVVAQPVTCWVWSSGISPLGTGYPDLEERLVVIPTGGNRIKGYRDREVQEWTRVNRSLLWSYYLRKIQEILVALLDGEDARIHRELPEHQRHRLQEWYSILAIANGDRGRPTATTLEWLRSAHTGEQDSKAEGSSLVSIIGTLPSYLSQTHVKDQFPHVRVKNNGAVFEIITMPGMLFALMSKAARDYGLYMTHRSAKDLSYALRDLKEVCEEHGITLTKATTQRRLGGERGKTWLIEIHLDSIEALVDVPSDRGESFFGMDSGEEISPEELEQAHEEGGAQGRDPDRTGGGDTV